MAGTNHATRWNRRTWTAFEESTTGTTQNTQRRRHAQSLDKDSLQLPRPALAEEQERSLKYQTEHPHPVPSRSGRCNCTGKWQDQKESTWVFTYWEAGDNGSLASSILTEFFFGSLGKLGEWLRTNELNKAYVKKKGPCTFQSLILF